MMRKLKIEELPGYYEIYEKLLDGIPAERRLLRLSEEQRLLTLSDEMLRQLPDTYLRTFSTAAQEAFRKRIGRPAGG